MRRFTVAPTPGGRDSSLLVAEERGSRTLFSDHFDDDRERGTVLGSQGTSGVRRRGVDREGTFAIDHGALRICYPERPGWGQQALAYGPYSSDAGTAFSVLVLNGHNSSQTWGESAGHPNTPVKRAKRFLKGAARRILTSRSLRGLLPEGIQSWARPSCPHRYEWPPITENLAAGWFHDEAPTRRDEFGHAFSIRATGVDNAELTIRVCGETLPVVRGVQNVPLYLIGLLRDRGMMYYVASLPNVHGLSGHPMMRPIGIDPSVSPERGFVGLSQSILGEIGFRVDSRVHAVQAAHLSGMSTWFGTAHIADSLVGDGSLDRTVSEVGTAWMCERGEFERTNRGVRPVQTESLVWQVSDVPAGVIHVVLEGGSGGKPMGIAWRVQDATHFWALMLGHGRVQVYCVEDGNWQIVASEAAEISSATPASLQILDDGSQFQVAINGRQAFGHAIEDARNGTCGGVGVVAEGCEPQRFLRSLEVHPREVRIPDSLDAGQLWDSEPGTVALSDDFLGDPGAPLEEHTPDGAAGSWVRTLGDGRIDVTGNGAMVRATADDPNPGRTLYTLPWTHERFADLDVEIVPPGERQGEGEKGRGGLVFWQDENNYIVVGTYLDDWAIGRSVSSFFHIDGGEDIHRAVWTNVGHRLHWGTRYRLRAAFNGDDYRVWLNEELVLARALTDVFPELAPLNIRRVGIVANWEYGDDTGSLFRSFRAQRKSTP